MIRVRRFTTDDVAFGMRLKSLANWNQTEADWRRALALDSTGCFVGVLDDVPAATLATCRFGEIAWIAMVLTDPAFRGRGLATALLEHAIAYLREHGSRSIRLDATALGRPVYEKLGFRVDGEANRYFGRPTALTPSEVAGDFSIISFSEDHLSAAAALDAVASGNDRRSLLESMLHDEPSRAVAAVTGSRLLGFVMSRQGSRAVQVGPCQADDADVGAALLSETFAQLGGGQVYVDVPCANAAANRFAADRGLQVERTFLRMTLGDRVREEGSRTWANYGPEKG
jgi:GNAT superfamily N-acetyltransferase